MGNSQEGYSQVRRIADILSKDRPVDGPNSCSLHQSRTATKSY